MKNFLAVRSGPLLLVERAIARPLLIGAFVAGLVACDDLPTIPPSDDPLIDGWITEMGAGIASSPRLTILVEENPEDPGDGGYDKIYFFLEASTPVRYAVGKAPRRMVGVNGLEVGQRVQVWDEGVIVDTDPAQAGAAFVDITCESRTSCGRPGG